MLQNHWKGNVVSLLREELAVAEKEWEKKQLKFERLPCRPFTNEFQKSVSLGSLYIPEEAFILKSSVQRDTDKLIKTHTKLKHCMSQKPLKYYIILNIQLKI